MKTILTYTILIGFLFSAGGKILVLSHFLINQDYIAQNLCENRDKPVLKCNGKCHLAKELAKEEKKEKKQKLNPYEDHSTYIFVAFSKIYELQIEPYEKRDVFSFVQLNEPKPFIPSIFHPPTV